MVGEFTDTLTDLTHLLYEGLLNLERLGGEKRQVRLCVRKIAPPVRELIGQDEVLTCSF
jgi:hypothetical protein